MTSVCLQDSTRCAAHRPARRRMTSRLQHRHANIDLHRSTDACSRVHGTSSHLRQVEQHAGGCRVLPQQRREEAAVSAAHIEEAAEVTPPIIHQHGGDACNAAHHNGVCEAGVRQRTVKRLASHPRSACCWAAMVTLSSTRMQNRAGVVQQLRVRAVYQLELK